MNRERGTLDQPVTYATHAGKPPSERWPTAKPGIALLFLVVWAGCTPPRYPGPQIQEPPAGFYLKPETTLARELFPDREVIFRNAWVNASWGEVSTIHITGYAGILMRADVRDALEEARAAATLPVTFGELEEVTIDRRTGWGWEERMQTPETGTEWVAYRVVVPYDTISYAVELYSGDPAFKGVPDTLAAIASTFAVGETTWNVPLLVGIGLLIVVLFVTARKRAQARERRMQNVHFVKIPKKEGEEGAGPGKPAPGAGGGMPGGGAAKPGMPPKPTSAPSGPGGAQSRPGTPQSKTGAPPAKPGTPPS